MKGPTSVLPFIERGFCLTDLLCLFFPALPSPAFLAQVQRSSLSSTLLKPKIASRCFENQTQTKSWLTLRPRPLARMTAVVFSSFFTFLRL